MSKRATPHLSERLAVLWRRRRLFLIVCLLIGAGYLVRTLFLPSAYRSHALIHIETNEMGGLLGELRALEPGSSAETEMEIMRSFRVAEATFNRLTPNDFLQEENAYRPLEALARRLSDAPHGALSVQTARLDTGAPPETYVFDFNDDRLQVEHRVGDGKPKRTTVAGFTLGEPFTVGGRTLVLRSKGHYRDRRFRLDLRGALDGARWIRERVRVVEVGRRTGVVRLEFEASSPALSRAVAAALADSYLELKQSQRREKLVNALAFLEQQTGRVRERLKEAEDELDRFRAESGVLMLSERARWLVERSAELELEGAKLDLAVKEAERLREKLDAEAGTVVVLRALGEVDPITQALAEAIVRLELERNTLEQAGLKPAHPERERVESELRRTRSRLTAGLSAGLDARIGTLRRRRADLDATRETLEEETRKLPMTERAAAKLTRAVHANLKIFNLLVEREQEAQVALAATLASARLRTRLPAPEISGRMPRRRRDAD